MRSPARTTGTFGLAGAAVCRAALLHRGRRPARRLGDDRTGGRRRARRRGLEPPDPVGVRPPARPRIRAPGDPTEPGTERDAPPRGPLQPVAPAPPPAAD